MPHERTAPKPFVFVLMPFDSKFDDTYQLGIKAACTEAGAYCERVDEQLFDESILQHTYNQIARADVIVADMTDQNPNVFYEVGYAHALGKRVILLTQRAKEIPFNLEHFPHIVYGSIADLKRRLKRRVRWSIDNPKRSLAQAVSVPDVYSSGTRLKEGAHLEREIFPGASQTIFLQFDLHNNTERVLDGSLLRFAVITSQNFSAGPEITETIRLPDGRCLHHLRSVEKMFPGGWASILSSFRVEAPAINQTEDLILRTYSEVETWDVPFTFTLRMNLQALQTQESE